MKEVKKIAALLCILMSAIVLPNHTMWKKGIVQRYHDLRKDIIDHFYCVKCLSESTYFLSLLAKQDYCYQLCNCINQKECVQIDSTTFFHKKIKLCIQKMHSHQSLKPILVLLEDAKKRYYNQDRQFFHELFVLIFTVQKQILLREHKEKKQSLKNTTLSTIVEIGEKINKLPISEVLNAIDMLVRELPPFLEKYELNSKITWKEWLKKYWWVPPIFGAWFGLRILLSFQRSHYYFPPYMSPRPGHPITSNDPAWAIIEQESHFRDTQPNNS
ncbi:MAG TPA: hypothetical protein VJJ26_03345 [Candidatus Babeliales bacterium]|nr:hypothetical protein [Candidatus Babeliales bacterium]